MTENWNVLSSTLLLYENSIGGSSPCSAYCRELQQHITHLFHLLLASYTHPMTIEPTTLLNALLLQGKRCHLNKSLLADIKYLHSMLFHFGSLKIFLCLIGDEVGVS